MGAIATGARSAELSCESKTYVPAEAKIRCLRDQIIVEPLPVDHSNILMVFEKTKPLRGIVRAVGPGHYPKRYDHPDKHRRTKMWDSKVFQPTELKVGDVVEIGGYGVDDCGHVHRGFGFQQFYWGNKMHIICREADVAGVLVQNVTDGASENGQTIQQNQEGAAA